MAKKIVNNTLTINVDFKENQRNDIVGMMDYFSENLGSSVDYVIENKIKNRTPHVHGITETKYTQQTVRNLLIKTFYGNCIDTEYCFDPDGWVSYMTKQNSDIITAKPRH